MSNLHDDWHAKLRVPMNPEQEKFLRRRLREAIGKQPELRRLKTLLLRLGGEYLVAPPKPDQDLFLLLESGFVMNGRIKLSLMDTSSCHQNVATAWKRRKLGIVGIATGYALSKEDGLWRQHSWGVLRDGILETTKVRQKYFGILLQGSDAQNFARSNLTNT